MPASTKLPLEQSWHLRLVLAVQSETSSCPAVQAVQPVQTPDLRYVFVPHFPQRWSVVAVHLTVVRSPALQVEHTLHFLVVPSRWVPVPQVLHVRSLVAVQSESISRPAPQTLQAVQTPDLRNVPVPHLVQTALAVAVHLEVCLSPPWQVVHCWQPLVALATYLPANV